MTWPGDPPRLCQALAIDLADNGADLSTGPLTLTLGEPVRSTCRPGRGSGSAVPRTTLAVLGRRATRRVSAYRPAKPR